MLGLEDTEIKYCLSPEEFRKHALASKKEAEKHKKKYQQQRREELFCKNSLEDGLQVFVLISEKH